MCELPKCERKGSCSTSHDTLSERCRKKSGKNAKKRNYICSFGGCKKSYANSAHLRRHEEIHIVANFKCTEENCGREFKTRFTLKKHIKNLHLKKIPKKYKCSFCDEHFNKYSWFAKHVFKKHTGVKPYLCPNEGCKRRFLVPSKLKRHMTVHKDFTCTGAGCSKVFPMWSLLRSHIKLCHPTTPTIHKCLECSKEFSKSSNLKAHLETHKQVREVLQCPKPGCNRVYSRKSGLNHHLRSYHEKRPFVCEQEQCHRAFESEAALVSHCSLHDKKKNSHKSKLIRKSSSRKRSDIKCLLKSTQKVSYNQSKRLIASSSIQPARKSTRAKSSNNFKGTDVSPMLVNKTETSHVQKNNETSLLSVSSKISTVSSEKSPEVTNNSNSQTNYNKDCSEVPSFTSSQKSMSSDSQKNFNKTNIRWQKNEETSVSDECDEIMILPTPPKPQPPVITLDEEENSAVCLNTRVSPRDVCSRGLISHKETQTVTPLLMSGIKPCLVVSEKLPVILLNQSYTVINNNPNGTVIFATNYFQQLQ